MELRPFLVLGTLFALLAGNAYLIYTEVIATKSEQVVNELRNTDPLIDLTYSKGNRAENFEKFGMDSKMNLEAMQFISDLEEEYRRKISRMLINAGDPTALARSLCGNTNDVRPRYAALEFLVAPDGEELRPLDLQSVSDLEPQEWASVSPWSRVFQLVELGSSRQEDATVMGVAAILTRQEQKVIQHERPWGHPYGGGSAWSWRKVKNDYPSIDRLVLEYLALMHITVEIAQSDDGICGA
jgi:hypothetical protein